MESISSSVFSKKNESETPTKTASSFNYTKTIGVLLLVALLYYFREQVYSLYQVYVADSVRRFFGETLLKMNLTPKGEFITTYVPDLSSLGKMMGVSSATASAVSAEEISLDNIGV